jgi:hypothetical protein
MTRTPNTDIPAAARIYDYFLGGEDHYKVDREAAIELLAAFPNAQNSARASRGFVLRAARFMAEQGVTQFLDIGAGIPTVPNVHQVVRDIRPDARVVYVDNDPVAIAKGQALRDEDGVVTVDGDLRKPSTFLDNPDVHDMISFSRPVGVFTVALWHFIGDEHLAPAQAELRDALAPGSCLAMSHACTDYLTAAQIRAAEALYKRTSNPVKARTRQRIEALLDGFDVVEPGLVGLHEWRPADGDPYPERSPEALAGVGIRRTA